MRVALLILAVIALCGCCPREDPKPAAPAPVKTAPVVYKADKALQMDCSEFSLPTTRQGQPWHCQMVQCAYGNSNTAGIATLWCGPDS